MHGQQAKLEDICTMSVGEFSIGTYIAHYVDELQRGRLTGSGGDAANSKAERLSKVVKLFAFVRDKDVVLDVCRGLLAKRLLGMWSLHTPILRSSPVF